MNKFNLTYEKLTELLRQQPIRNEVIDYPTFDDEEVIEVIMDSISDDLRKKLSREDIRIIIDLEFKYLEIVNLLIDPDNPSLVTYMADLDGDAMDAYVIEKAQIRGIPLSTDELQEIWAGEDVYYDINGMLSEVPLEELN